MRNRRTFQRCLTGILCILGFLTTTGVADGQVGVPNCHWEGTNYSPRALVPDVTAGMRIHSACGAGGYGLQALVLGNSVERGTVKYRAFAALKIPAPSGTQFTTITWAGDGRRTDCGFAAQMWAEGPQVGKINLRNYASRPRCRRTIPGPHGGTATANIRGATTIFVRVQCVGVPRGSSCSMRRSNYFRLTRIEANVADLAPPTVAINPSTHLAHGDWVTGEQALLYDASDNIGVRTTDAYVSGGLAGEDAHACNFAAPVRAFGVAAPCTGGSGWIRVDTAHLPQGTQPLVVTATDAAGNVGSAPPVTVRIDNEPPARVAVAVTGGDAWRSTNDFAVSWANPAESDRAPVTGAQYKLCPAAGGTCVSGGNDGIDGISSLAVQVPSPGEWQLSLWRDDAAGNGSHALASDPVNLRYDPDPPQLAFEPLSASDPTQVTVDAHDPVSGVASGSIEISQNGSGVWRDLPTQIADGRLIARFDDAALPAGEYLLRAHAIDQARNEATTESRTDGQAMAVALPVRLVTAMHAAFRITQTVTERIRRHGRRATARRRVTVMRPSLRAKPAEAAQLIGRLTNAAGEGIAGQQVEVLASSSMTPEHPVAMVQTGSDGTYEYSAVANGNQTLRFVFPGSPVMLPTQATVTIVVPAATSMRVSRRRLHNGQTVRFSGVLQTLPAPAAGKLLELQVLLPKGWETFRTIRTDANGRWAARYHFTRTYGVQRYRFRARLPKESGYQFAAGQSRVASVVVKGSR